MFDDNSGIGVISEGQRWVLRTTLYRELADLTYVSSFFPKTGIFLSFDEYNIRNVNQVLLYLHT